MKATRQATSAESDSIVTESCMPQPRMPYEERYANEAFEQQIGTGERFPVYHGPNLASHFLLPSPQSSLNDSYYLTMNTHRQPNLVTLGDFRTNIVEDTNPTEPLTVLPFSKTGQEAMSYSEDIWDLHKPRVRQLYLEEDKKLPEVMRQMKEEKDFKPSISMYKAHLSAWGIYKNNRERDVLAILSLKQTRDLAGQSSAIFRSKKRVDMQKVYRYLKRKKWDPRVFEQARENGYVMRMTNHIFARTPSPLTPASNLRFPSGGLRFKEMILLSINRGYTFWINKNPRVINQDISEPHLFCTARMRGLNTIDVVSLLLQYGLKFFQENQFSKGGSYIQAAFIFVEFHVDQLSKAVNPEEQSLSWIFGLWRTLTSGIPHELSRILLGHIMKVSHIHFSEMQPMLEILRCLYDFLKEEGQELFLSFISSIWADAINTIDILLQSGGLYAVVCLPHSLWMNENNGHCQFQDKVLEFRRVETFESWQQRLKSLSFPLGDTRQIYYPSPSHTDVLTLIWLRRSLVHKDDAIASPRLSVQGDTQHVDRKSFLVKTASVTRLELSVGKWNYSSESDNIRVLSGDMYQVRQLHGPRLGEGIDTFKGKQTLDLPNFEIMENKFQATRGVETDKVNWLKWLQILEESLIGPWEAGQRLESVVSCQCLRGKGVICTNIATKEGEVGIRKIANEDDDESTLEDGWLRCDIAFFQN